MICRYRGAPKSLAAVLATTKETTPTAVAPGSLGSGGSAGGRSFSVLFPFLPGNKDIVTARESAGDGEVRLKDVRFKVPYTSSES